MTAGILEMRFPAFSGVSDERTIVMDHREFNQLIEVLKSIDRNLKRIGDKLMTNEITYTCYDPQKSEESILSKEE